MAAVVHFLLEMLVMIEPIGVPSSPEVCPHHHEAMASQQGMSSVISLCCRVRFPVGEILQHRRELLSHINILATLYQGDEFLKVQHCPRFDVISAVPVITSDIFRYPFGAQILKAIRSPVGRV